MTVVVLRGCFLPARQQESRLERHDVNNMSNQSYESAISDVFPVWVRPRCDWTHVLHGRGEPVLQTRTPKLPESYVISYEAFMSLSKPRAVHPRHITLVKPEAPYPLKLHETTLNLYCFMFR